MNETEGDDALSINWLLVPAYANCKSDLHAMICFDGDELVLRVNIGSLLSSGHLGPSGKFKLLWRLRQGPVSSISYIL